MTVVAAHLLDNVHVVDDPMRAHDELGLGRPLMISDVVARLQPQPLLAFREEAIVARGPFAFLFYLNFTVNKCCLINKQEYQTKPTCFVASNHLLQIVKMIVVVAGCTEHLEWQIPNDGRCPKVQE